jgi:hypothetical protein
MIKENDYIDVYHDYDFKTYIPSENPLDPGYELPPKIDGEPYYVSVLWKDIMKANMKSENFKNQSIRFAPDVEEQAYKQLRIDINKDKNSYSRDEIERMILYPTDSVLKRITEIDKLTTIDAFLSLLVYLKNTNKYLIAEKVELYIRARKEEIEQGIRKSELEVDKTENVELAVTPSDENVETVEVESENETEVKEEVKTNTRNKKNATK